MLPDGRFAEIRHTFVRSALRPALGAVGAFYPAKGAILWSTGLRDECLYFGAGADTLASLCEKAALLPCRPERSAARDAYLAARKFLRAETIGGVLAVEQETPDPMPGAHRLDPRRRGGLDHRLRDRTRAHIRDVNPTAYYPPAVIRTH